MAEVAVFLAGLPSSIIPLTMQRSAPSSSKAQRVEQPTGETSWRWRIGLPVLVLVGFVFASSLGYHLIERNYSWLDSLYMTVITVATVGFQEVQPLSEWGRVWTIVVITSGLIIGAVVMSMVVGMVVEGQVRAVFGRRQLQRKIEALNKHIILAGHGNMGTMVAAELKMAGQQIVTIETDPERTAAAQKAGILYVLGDSQDEAALLAAGIGRAAVLVSMLPTDAQNVFVTLTARQLNPDIRVIARASQPSAESKLRAAGAARVICPQTLGASRVADVLLRPAVVDFVDMAHRGIDLEMDQLILTAESSLCGKTFRELALPRRVGGQVVVVRQADGEAIYHPTPDLKLNAGDTLVLIGKRGVAAAIQELQPQVEA